MFRRVTIIFLILLVVLFCNLPQVTAQYISKLDRKVLAFVSDTQEPIFFEKIFIESNRNEEATKLIFEDIEKNEDLKALFHLGDLTAFGSIDSEWENIDKYLQRLRNKDIPIYPAMGNHDYMIFKSGAVANFQKRFPDITSSWYKVIIDSIAVIILNSNYYRLEDYKIKEQIQWLESTLHELENDAAVKFIIFALHHSPYTNSTVVDPSEDVQNDFVPKYLNSRKSILFLSGHSHAAEHFKINRKDFLVCGGGGGLQHKLLIDSNQRWHDHLPLKTAKRMFHYLLCERRENILIIRVMMLNDDFKSFTEVYKLEIKY